MTRRDQAALVLAGSLLATPSVNLTPSMTRGNWFAPFRRRHFFDAARTRVNTISFTVFCDRAPFVRTVRCRTVAKTLSTGFEVRWWSQCSAGQSKNVSSASVSLVRQATAGAYLTPYFYSKTLMEARAAAFVPAWWMSCRSDVTVGAMDFGNLLRTFELLWNQQR